jgi:polysaccharide export outer membrane protein
MKKIPLLLVTVFISILMNIHTSSGNEYIIGEEDVLQISVWGNPELNVQVPVKPGGMISVPLIGDIEAAGHTPKELKILLEKEFVRFVKTPTVSVVITEINSFKVYVIGGGEAGESDRPFSGVITLKRNTTLLQLIAQSGSLGSVDLNDSYLLRDGKRLDVDLFKLLVKGDISQDIHLKPNDILFLHDNYEKRIRVVGAVITPGIFEYREGMTALDAVLNAGGFTEFAKQNEVVIVRKEGDEIRNIEARLKDLIRDGDIKKDVSLTPGDLVIVKTGIF